MKYIVYLTTNKINNKIYIGVHQTEDPNKFDGYLGEGSYINKPSSYNKGKCHFHNALLKYGVNNFYRKTLKVFDNLEDALDLEAWLVTDEFIKRTDTYNMTRGGQIPPLHNKTVYQFDLNGKFLKQWDSIVELTKLYKCNHQRISMAINEKRSFDNCYWSFENQIDVSLYRISTRGYVYQYNQIGELLNVFKNASEAAIKLDLSREAIVNAIFNRCKYSGFYFLNVDENIKKLLDEKSKKLNSKFTPVFRYKLTGEFDKEYNTIAEACADVGSNHSNIITAIKKNKTSKGYRWSYIKSKKILPFSKLHIKSIKIAQYDKNHNLIKIWDSVSECKKEFPSCQKVCRKERKTSKGYIFEYIS